MKWGSFDGRSKEIEDLDDQHLSNILWYYHLLIPDCTIKDRVIVEIGLELLDRLGEWCDGTEEKPYRHCTSTIKDVILPYRPMVNFSREIEALKSKGYIKGIGLNEDIIVNGEVIGQVVQGVQTNKFSFV
jgi:hypothetical protein